MINFMELSGRTQLSSLMIFWIWNSYFQWHRTVFWSKLIMSTMLITTTLNIMMNSWRCTVFILGASKVDQTTIFLWNGWILPTSEYLEVKTVYPRDLIMKFKVVHNVVSDNFNFDHKTVGSNLTEVFFKVFWINWN